MVNTAKELRKAGLDIPLMVGGATTSELHVALKIAPVYDGPVLWVKDAAQEPILAARLMSSDGRAQLEQELKERYARLCNDYQQKQEKILSLEEARKRKPNLFD